MQAPSGPGVPPGKGAVQRSSRPGQGRTCAVAVCAAAPVTQANKRMSTKHEPCQVWSSRLQGTRVGHRACILGGPKTGALASRAA